LGQLQAYLPHVASAPDPVAETSGKTATLTWYDAPRDVDVTLKVDSATGVPLQMQQVPRKSGSTLTVNYAGWNTPVEIAVPTTR